MAERIGYDVKPTKTSPDAQDELQRLLDSLHKHGMLRLANDLVCANTQIAKVVVDGLNKEGTLNALQNLSLLLMALSRIPPARFQKTVFAITDALDSASRYRPEPNEDEAPGLSGAYRMLNDEDLWRALHPLIAGLKAFSQHLDRDEEKPISAFTGKPSAA
ncbi:DUF1641 domain-containing protein [Dongia soli]|uniref:DUF1641 domain-containing protein n=1 Tax=Dongia soli TaxID=600628 RepID=A0ABU5EH64_9PROT|nr:hypothetical protein [Dongia soli]MDY0884721.1 hypothetical protein [Dongia soli]